MDPNDFLCIYCKSDDTTRMYPTYDLMQNKYYIHKCNKCEVYFLVPKPGKVALIEAYDSSYYGANIEKFSLIIEFFLSSHQP